MFCVKLIINHIDRIIMDSIMESIKFFSGSNSLTFWY